MTFEFKMATTQEILVKRGLEEGGRVQQVVDNAILKFIDPYVPFDTGMLRDNGLLNTVIGSGEIIYEGPYAHNVMTHEEYNFQGAPMRGAYPFDRMKVDHGDEILRQAANEAGGEAIWQR